MKYSIFVKTPDCCYIHQSGHAKDKAEYIASILNEAVEDMDDCKTEAIVMTDDEAKAAVAKANDTPYFAVLENGCVVFIEITPAMKKVIESSYEGDEEAYFAEVICEEYNISYNNCQWSLTCESQIACYGKKPKIAKV